MLLFAFRFFFVRHGEKTQCGIWHFYRLDSGSVSSQTTVNYYSGLIAINRVGLWRHQKNQSDNNLVLSLSKNHKQKKKKEFKRVLFCFVGEHFDRSEAIDDKRNRRQKGELLPNR